MGDYGDNPDPREEQFERYQAEIVARRGKLDNGSKYPQTKNSLPNTPEEDERLRLANINKGRLGEIRESFKKENQ